MGGGTLDESQLRIGKGAADHAKAEAVGGLALDGVALGLCGSPGQDWDA